MVHDLARLLKEYGYAPGIRIAAGYDSEYYAHPGADCRNPDGSRGCNGANFPGAEEWTTYYGDNIDEGTLRWADGYNYAESLWPAGDRKFLYNFGSCEDCPRTGQAGDWASGNLRTIVDRVYHLTYGLDQVVPFPQTYFIRIPYEWYNVRWFVYYKYGRQMVVRGAMTGCVAAPGYNPCQPIVPVRRLGHRFNLTCHSGSVPDCDSAVAEWARYNCPANGEECPYLPPSVGWQALTDMLSSQNTPQGLPNPYLPPQPMLTEGVTDIAYEDLSP